MTDGPLMLLDSASLYFRAFHGIKESVTAPDGTPVNAVRGFLDSITRLITDVHPTALVCCWDDDWRPAFRVAAIPSYKAHRVVDESSGQEEVPDALSPQVPIIVEVLRAIGIARVGVPGHEADDVIGSIATQARGPVDIVTGDRDLFQLVDDARSVRVLYTAKGGVARPEIITETAVTERYAIPGHGYADFAVLRGDPSDGLPGVPGIGEKTAATLISTYGSLAGVVAAAEVDDPRVRASIHAKVRSAHEYLAVAPAVVRVVTDLDVTDVHGALPAAPHDPDELARLVTRWGLGGSATRLVAALASASSSNRPDLAPGP